MINDVSTTSIVLKWVAIVVAYLAIGGIMGGIVQAIDSYTGGNFYGFGSIFPFCMLWPFVLLVAIVIGVVYLPLFITERIVTKIMEVINGIR